MGLTVKYTNYIYGSTYLRNYRLEQLLSDASVCLATLSFLLLISIGHINLFIYSNFSKTLSQDCVFESLLVRIHVNQEMSEYLASGSNH